jgi:hypothetical protein
MLSTNYINATSIVRLTCHLLIMKDEQRTRECKRERERGREKEGKREDKMNRGAKREGGREYRELNQFPYQLNLQ